MTERRERWAAPAWPRQTVITAWILLLLIFLAPLLLLSGTEELPQESASPAAALPADPAQAGAAVPGWDGGRTLRLLKGDGTVEELVLSDYLWGVVAAEMPVSFQPEALKAQAVCARTYCIYQSVNAQDKHPQADVCTDPACCQAYLTAGQAAELWGEDAREYTDKVRRAVEETDGLLCLYGGSPIDAVFFSSAAGRTSDAKEVWGKEVPYLRSVDSPEGEEVPGWQTVTTYPADQVKEMILARWPQADLSGAVETWFSTPALAASGAVSTVTVGGVETTGPQLRAAFGLRSAHVAIEPGEDAVTFRVTGYGHGVGLSQYGANALALQGEDFREILAWYYTGITVSGWDG